MRVRKKHLRRCAELVAFPGANKGSPTIRRARQGKRSCPAIIRLLRWEIRIEPITFIRNFALFADPDKKKQTYGKPYDITQVGRQQGCKFAAVSECLAQCGGSPIKEAGSDA